MTTYHMGYTEGGERKHIIRKDETTTLCGRQHMQIIQAADDTPHHHDRLLGTGLDHRRTLLSTLQSTLETRTMTITIALYEIGGSVRDALMGLRTKDLDFAVEITGIKDVPTAFDAMRNYLNEAGFKIFVETPEYATIRALFPRGHPMERLTADFVLCRKDGPSSDGRRPDYVEVGTLYDDQARRDFRCNSAARLITEDGIQGTLIDPFHGAYDIEIGRLSFVGDPMDRIREDGLRILRAIRFKITKGFEFDQGIRDALADPESAELLSGTSAERRREELEKCCHHDTIGTIDLLCHDISPVLRDAIFNGLRLSATQKRDFVHAQTKKR